MISYKAKQYDESRQQPWPLPRIAPPTEAEASSRPGSSSRPPSARRGQLRLKGGQGLDAAHHARRAQGLRGAARAPAGPGAPNTAPTRAADLAGTARSRGRAARLPTQPYVRDHRRRAGRHRARRPAAPARRADDHRRHATRGPVTPGATATSRCACTTRSGTTTCRTSIPRRTGRSSRRRTRSATGWRCTPR